MTPNQLECRVHELERQVAELQVVAGNLRPLTRNMADFNRVPGLRVEDWLS